MNVNESHWEDYFFQTLVNKKKGKEKNVISFVSIIIILGTILLGWRRWRWADGSGWRTSNASCSTWGTLSAV